MATLYDTWLNRIDSYYEERYYEPVIEELCQYHGGSADARDGKGKFFNAGYEVFIYAFFLGLYYGERTPLTGPKRKFRMEMFTWGRKSTEAGRKDYTVIQKYIFAALIAKSDVDLLAVDKGELSLDDACDILMTTLNEYANTGFQQLLPPKQDQLNTKLLENTGLLDMIRNFCGK
ncbi:MAG: glycoside hydrolase family 15 [Bacteroidaceae bacterium]|nr:glycoside hydrolase family 15 [Bacteroidaceae bacterium]